MIGVEIEVLKKELIDNIEFFISQYKKDNDAELTFFIHMCSDSLNDLASYEYGIKLNYINVSSRAKEVLKQCSVFRS